MKECYCDDLCCLLRNYGNGSKARYIYRYGLENVCNEDNHHC
jgi:hypothetical protein